MTNQNKSIDDVFSKLKDLETKAKDLLGTTVAEEAKAKEFNETLDMMVEIVRELGALPEHHYYPPVITLIKKAKEIIPRLDKNS